MENELQDKTRLFIEQVVKGIQSDYSTTKECKAALIEVLEEADKLYIELTGKPIAGLAIV